MPVTDQITVLPVLSVVHSHLVGWYFLSTYLVPLSGGDLSLSASTVLLHCLRCSADLQLSGKSVGVSVVAVLQHNETSVLCVACVVRGGSFLIVLCGERNVLPYCSVW